MDKKQNKTKTETQTHQNSKPTKPQSRICDEHLRIKI